MNSIKIGYFADGEWAVNAFHTMLKNPRLEIQFICARYKSEDTRLFDLAKNYNIDFFTTPNINTDSFNSKISSYGCDLFVSMSFNQIFKSKTYSLAPLGTINCHAGKLPFYRGRNVLNWVLINDEKEFGITVHYVDSGIDTGDIIEQKTFKINDSDNYYSLLKIAYENCAIVLSDALNKILDDKVIRLKQVDIHEIGTYCGIRTIGDEILDWNQNSREIFNFVRAISNPGPIAQTRLKDEIVLINKVSLIEGAPKYKGISGQVVGMSSGRPIVKTLDTTIIIDELFCEKKIFTGDRFY